MWGKWVLWTNIIGEGNWVGGLKKQKVITLYFPIIYPAILKLNKKIINALLPILKSH